MVTPFCDVLDRRECTLRLSVAASFILKILVMRRTANSWVLTFLLCVSCHIESAANRHKVRYFIVHLWRLEVLFYHLHALFWLIDSKWLWLSRQTPNQSCASAGTTNDSLRISEVTRVIYCVCRCQSASLTAQTTSSVLRQLWLILLLLLLDSKLVNIARKLFVLKHVSFKAVLGL